MKGVVKYLSGILGGLIFSIPWLLVYVFFNFSVGYLNCLIVFGIILGYKVVNKEIYNDRKTKKYLIISSCLITLLNVLILMPIIVMIKQGVGVNLESFKILYTNDEFISVISDDLTLALLMTLPPAIFFPLDFKNEKTGKADIQMFIEEVEEIFNKYGAISKDTAVSKKVIKNDISNIKTSKFKKIFYLDTIKNIYIKNKKDKWYFDPKKRNLKYGLLISIYFLVLITISWNVFVVPNTKDINKTGGNNGEIIEYKEDEMTLMLPDCMELDEKEKDTEEDVDTYYYSYLSMDISKSDIQIVEIYYYPSFEYEKDYNLFSSSIKSLLDSSEIALEKNKTFNGNNTLYLKLNKYDKERIVNSYFVMLPDNKLIEVYVYVTKDSYSSLDEGSSDDIVKSIKFNF